MSEHLYGRPVEMGNGIQRILAPNPSPMTFHGTNTYIIDREDLAIVDPGPLSGAHLNAIRNTVAGRKVAYILVTHAHRDHSLGARPLSDALNAPVVGFGPAEAGRRAIMDRLAATVEIGGGEGRDETFQPDIEVRAYQTLPIGTANFRIHHTPGHFAGHLAFEFDDDYFTGDHLMDWSTTLISPPDGDLAEFNKTSARMIELAPKRCLPGHGGVIEAPTERLQELMRHRLSREASILENLRDGAATIPLIVEKIYRETPQNLRAAAARNVFSHMIDLVERDLVTAHPTLMPSSKYSLK